MNYFRTSTGERLAKSVIDAKIKKAKQAFLERFLDENGYYFCEGENCNRSDGRLSCAHIVSVNEAQNTGRAELCFDVNNFKLLCIKCHQKQDKNGIMSGKIIKN